MNTLETRIFFFHDGVLEETDSLNNEGATHLVVTIVNGIPVSSAIIGPHETIHIPNYSKNDRITIDLTKFKKYRFVKGNVVSGWKDMPEWVDGVL